MTTHTYAKLEVSKSTYDEIRSKLEAAGYEHAFHEDGLIDMHGIALEPGASGASTVREDEDTAVLLRTGLNATSAGWDEPSLALKAVTLAFERQDDPEVARVGLLTAMRCLGMSAKQCKALEKRNPLAKRPESPVSGTEKR